MGYRPQKLSAMKSLLLISSLALLSLTVRAGNPWRAVTAAKGVNERGGIYALDVAAIKQQLAMAETISLPLPNGNYLEFHITETPIIPAALAARYPDIHTYTGTAVNNPFVTAKIDLQESGFHAMVFDGDNTFIINPSTDKSAYTSHYKKDEQREYKPGCDILSHTKTLASQSVAAKTTNGVKLRSYRIAIACDHQYAQAATGTETPTKQQALNAIVTTLNRINGVYEREVAVTLKLIDKEDTMIFVEEAGDPFGASNNNGPGLLNLNQQYCDLRVGTDNYDLGHIFSTGGGGVSFVGVVCDAANKAKSVTGNSSPTGDGFDIDYVAHEIGHQFGAEHTFNNNQNGACAGNSTALAAYEPGSGSTIMAYAGICGWDNIQQHSDDYFHAKSLLQLNEFITADGDVCATKTATGNKLPFIENFTSFYYVPYLTPFELTAPEAVDSVAARYNKYCWEQWNLGDPGISFKNTVQDGPIFRSYAPDTSRTRIFPRLSMVLAGQKSDEGNNNAQGEKLPSVARKLTFRLTVRNFFGSYGGFLFPDDSIHLDVINTGAPFEVTSQGTYGLKYIGGSKQTVTWNVVGTTAAPINCTDVDIYLSLDGGRTWKYNLGTYPNTGTALVIIPDPGYSSINCRIKVKGHNNVFFNLNSSDFGVITNPGIYGDILLFPIPAHNTITIVTGDKGTINTLFYNAAGRFVAKTEIASIMDIDVSYWPRGVYIVKMMDVANKVTIKKFVLD